MFHEPLRSFAIRSPAMLIGSFVTSIGFLIACQVTTRELLVFRVPLLNVLPGACLSSRAPLPLPCPRQYLFRPGPLLPCQLPHASPHFLTTPLHPPHPLQVYAHSHPTNLYLLSGFTIAMAWGVATTCGAYAAAGYSMAVLEALVLTATATVGLTVYTLRSKQDFSYLGAGLGAALWVLILGGVLAIFIPGMQLAMAVAGAAIFSLYIVYDVHMIATRMSPDE
jgi:FtsH-binding integral membrane protein